MLFRSPNEKIRERLNSEFPNFPNDVPNNAEDLSSTVIRIAVEVFNEYLSKERLSEDEYEAFLTETAKIAYDILLIDYSINSYSEAKVKFLIRKESTEK